MREFTYNSIKDIKIGTALPQQKIGKENFHQSISVDEQTTADLGFLAAENLISTNEVDPNEIGALVLLTKTPDYRGPATAMVLQKRLGVSKDCIVYDSPTGNGGFEYALNLGAPLLNSTTKKYALVVCGDTISKQLSEQDLETLNFQDGATAILLEKGDAEFQMSMATKTLSENWVDFMVPSGGFRDNQDFFNELQSKRENQTAEHLHINTGNLNSSIQPELHSIVNKVNEIVDKNNSSDFAVIINLITPELEKELKSKFQSEKYAQNVFLSSEILPQTMASTVPLIMEKIISNSENAKMQFITVSIGEGLSMNISNFEIKKSSIYKTLYSDQFYDNGFVTHEM